MPVTYELDKHRGFIQTSCHGEVTLEEVMQHFMELQREADALENLDVLLDLGESLTSPETFQLRQIASEIEFLERDVSWGALAIVAVKDEQFAVGRMLEMFAENNFTQSRVFRNREEAENWLAIFRQTS